MPRPLPRDRWLADAAERFTTLEAWRQAHPTASWAEIEAAIDGELSQLRARMLGETAMTSDAATLAGAASICPDCGEPLQTAGMRHRRLRTEHDRGIDLDRTYARCPACGAGLFPPG